MRKLKLIGILCLVLMITVTGVGTAFAKKKLFKLKTCWLPEHEAFMAWYMVEKGWDREEGLDMELQYYDSGMAQLEALPSKSWHLGGNGATPTFLQASDTEPTLHRSATTSPSPTPFSCVQTAPF